MEALTFSFFAFLIRGVFLGFVAQHIATSKGYETGFAWGFWLGLIGVFVVAVKPEVNVSAHNYGEKNQYWKRLAGETPKQAPWCCVCGQENVADLQYCTRCGRTKEEGESKAFVKGECSHCGAMNKRTNEYCFACGKSLLSGEKQAEKKVHDHDVEANLDALKNWQSCGIWVFLRKWNTVKRKNLSWRRSEYHAAYVL